MITCSADCDTHKSIRTFAMSMEPIRNFTGKSETLRSQIAQVTQCLFVVNLIGKLIAVNFGILSHNSTFLATPSR
jgi:hypothetical protein